MIEVTQTLQLLPLCIKLVCAMKRNWRGRVLRERIIIKDTGVENKSQAQSGKLGQLPKSIGVFNFEQPYKHFVFDETDNNSIRKLIKFVCQVRVAIA